MTSESTGIVASLARVAEREASDDRVEEIQTSRPAGFEEGSGSSLVCVKFAA